MLELKHVSLSRVGEGDRKDILKDISLDVADGTFLVVTGPNGGGKTTLAKIVMGIERPTAGKIIWNGRDITNDSMTQRANQGISYGFQQPPRFQGLRVWDLLSLATGSPNLTQEEGCKRLAQVGLCGGEYIDREVDSTLSGGEMKRIEIATILARNTPLMIFDEPEAGIDLWSFAKLAETFCYIHDTRRATMIVISHQERILELADEIVMVAEGQVTERGTREEMFPKMMKNIQTQCDFMKGGGTA